MHILVVDDEELIRDVVCEYAQNEGFKCDEAENGAYAIKKVESNNYDCIIMDIMMPNMDGFTAIKEIKQLTNTPVICLSARGEEFDKLQGFKLGIDDYVTKPFSPKELIARIKAVTKRTNGDLITVGDITIDDLKHEVTIDSEVVELTHTQFCLLKLFLSNVNIALSRNTIIESIWGYDYEADDRTIDAHIKLLRSKLGKYRNSIKTINYVAAKVENQSPAILDYSLEKYAYKYDMCIEYFNGNEYSSYNTKINGCVLNNNDANITSYKKALVTQNRRYMKVYDDEDKINSLIYYVNMGEDQFAFLNINLEDANSSSYLVKDQLIYLVLILIIISFFVSIFVSRVINKPIIKLTEEAKKLGKGVPVHFGESNIKEIDELANTLTVAASEMNKTDELRKDLIANVSHDLKTPLTMIKAYAEKVRDLSFSDEEKRNKDLNVIIEETDRLNNLVNDLLDLSKLESGMNTLKFEEYDLVDNIKEIIKRYDILIEDNNYKFETDLPKKLIVKADKQKIEQVIYNLINNAIEHTGDDLVVKVAIKKYHTG